MKIASHPTWSMFVALIFVFFLSAVLTLGIVSNLDNAIHATRSDFVDIDAHQKDILVNQQALLDNAKAAKERGYATRAVGCMSLVIDNDRTFDLTGECTDHNVAHYYPPQVCAALTVQVEDCGSKAT